VNNWIRNSFECTPTFNYLASITAVLAEVVELRSSCPQALRLPVCGAGFEISAGFAYVINRLRLRIFYFSKPKRSDNKKK